MRVFGGEFGQDLYKLMQIIIEIKNKITKLILRNGEKQLDEVVFLDEENISEALLPLFDTLLVRNNLAKENIESVEIETDLGENFTSRRIAEAFKNTFDWTIKQGK